MAIKLKIDPANNIEMPTMVLTYRNGRRIGAIQPEELRHADSMGNQDEFSFDITKSLCPHLWDYIRDFRLIWIPEWDRYYEIEVQIDQEINTVKHISAAHLCENELSQMLLFEVEINTDEDIDASEEEGGTVFFDEENPDKSLLHRITHDKAVNYRFGYVAESLKNIQRTFSFDNCSVYDAFQEIAEEIHCIFEFVSRTDKETGRIVREINAYDLENVCRACGERGEFTVCPECGSTDIATGYGEDTTVFLSLDNVLDSVTYTTNVDAVKNCFRLEGGDEDMTAAIMNCNPSGTQYIWYITDETKEDMSPELREAYEKYENLYQEYSKTKQFNLNVEAYNALVEKYSKYNDELMPIQTPLVGYSELVSADYVASDLSVFLQHTMMPEANNQLEETSASEEVAKLTTSALSPVAVMDLKVASEPTTTAAVKAMAKVVVDSRYEVKTSETSYANGTWKGKFTVTNYSDEDDIAVSDLITVTINDNYEDFVKQKIDRTLAKGDKKDYSIKGIFSLGADAFQKELQKYGLTSLEGFNAACDGVISILQEQGVASSPDKTIYNNIYKPYLDKKAYIEAEMSIRSGELKVVSDLQEQIREIEDEVWTILDLDAFFGPELAEEFYTFRREDVYSNSNYTSEGYTSAEIIDEAQRFFKAANKEIYKSATLQHSITATLKNLLAIPAFKPLREHFSLGNWLRIEVDDQVYKLRLISYEMDSEHTDVEFSDVERIGSDLSDIRSIVDNMRTISSSYAYVERQADKAHDTANTLNNWVSNGLDMTLTKIVNNADHQTFVMDEHGGLFRKYDDVMDIYAPEQTKIVNGSIVITKDNWKTVSTALGRFYFVDPKDGKAKEGYGINAEILIGKLIMGEELYLQNLGGNLKFDKTGFYVGDESGNPKFVIDNSGGIELNADKIHLKASSDLVIDSGNFKLDASGNVNIKGFVEASSGKIGKWTINDGITYDCPTHAVHVLPGTNGNKDYLVVHNKETNTYPFFVRANGQMNATNATISGDITAKRLTATESGQIACWLIDSSAIYTGTKVLGGSGMYFGTSGLSLTDKFKVTSTGQMTATNADITGKIRATEIYAENAYKLKTNNVERTIITGNYFNYSTGAPFIKMGFDESTSFTGLTITGDSKGNFVSTEKRITIDAVSISLAASNTNVEGYLNVGNGGYFLRTDTDADGDFVRSEVTYNRTYTNSPNMYITSYGTFGRHTSSSARYKHSIKELSLRDIEGLYTVPVHTFKYNAGYISETDERYDKNIPGFISEEIDEILPIAVDHKNGKAEMWSSNIMIPCLLKLIQNNHEEIKELRKEIQNLKYKSA